jgi:hypothetical protein
MCFSQEDERMRFTKISPWKMKGLWLPLLLLVVLPGRSAWAQVDLTGEWSPRIFNDGRDIGDYTGIPLNEAGRLRAESWHPEQIDLPENVCRPHSFDIGLRVAPAQLYISNQLDSATQQIVGYHLHAYWSDLWVWMDGRPHPPDYAAHKWSGFSTGKWEGNTLVITTDHLKEGYLTRTGVSISEKATVSTRITRYGNYLTMVFIIYDPAYLAEPYIRESSWVYDPKQMIPAFPCEIPAEGALIPAGSVPSYLPGKNDVLSDFAVEYGIPPEAALGGAETTHPEYIEKMKHMKTLPRTTTKHFERRG